MEGSIGKRLSRYVGTLPLFAAREFQKYWKRYRSNGGGNLKSAAAPYWLLLPRRLNSHFRNGKNQSRGGNSFLSDVLFGQYLLFLFIRIQDDLLDGQVECPSLVFVADQFLLEAGRLMAKHFPSHMTFWDGYRSALKATTLAILEVRENQTSSHTTSRRLLPLYKRVNAVLNVGSWAVCCRYQMAAQYKRVEKGTGHVAIGSQILDDFCDVADDLNDSRFNYAAKALVCQSSLSGASPEKVKKVIVRNLVNTSKGLELLSEARAHFIRGFAALQGFRFKDFDAYRNVYLRSVDGMIQRLQGLRFEHAIMSGLLPARRRRK